jgi:hypothetical protein
MTARTQSPAKPERSVGRKFIGATTKRTLSGDVRWIAQATINGEHFVFGTWATAEEAATAFDRAVLHYRGQEAPRNFPERRDLLPADAKQLQEEAHRAAKKRQESPYDGVSRVGGEHWTAKLRVDGLPRGLGTWPTAEAAAIAYDRAVLKYYGKTARRNFPERRSSPRKSSSCRPRLGKREECVPRAGISASLLRGGGRTSLGRLPFASMTNTSGWVLGLAPRKQPRPTIEPCSCIAGRRLFGTSPNDD